VALQFYKAGVQNQTNPNALGAPGNGDQMLKYLNDDGALKGSLDAYDACLNGACSGNYWK
jgi:hypothetical protein